MRLVIVESPYAGKPAGWISKVPVLRWLAALVLRWRNVRYARAAVRDSVLRGEAPIASHLLLTQPGILRDHIPEERQRGIEAGLHWGDLSHFTSPARAPLSAFYVDLGISGGMTYGEHRAWIQGRMSVRRTLDGWTTPWWARWAA